MNSASLFFTLVVSVSCAALWRYDPRVSQADRARLEVTFTEIVQFAIPAAQVMGRVTSGAAGPEQDMYNRYYPWSNNDPNGECYPERIAATWNQFAGIPQFWPPQGMPNSQFVNGITGWSKVTILPTSELLSDVLAVTLWDEPTDQCTIKFNRRAFRYPDVQQANGNLIRDCATDTMDMLVGVLIHEMMHCPPLYRETWGTYKNGNQLTPGKIQIDDIPSPDRSVYRGDTYGAYPCQQLKRLAPAKAVLNADNWVYFGQEALWSNYFRHYNQPRIFGPTTLQKYRNDCGWCLRISQFGICNA